MRVTNIVLCGLMLAFLPFAAYAKPLISDLSQYRIPIDSSFTGTSLLLFGARQDAGDVVVVVRGPESDFVVRKKERVAGIWVNRHQEVFQGLPYFYRVYMDDARQRQWPDVLHRLAILPEQGGPVPDDFRQAFMRDREKQALYMPPLDAVSFMGETLFKVDIDFPDTIPRGMYTAEVYLLQDGELVGMQSTPLKVEKQGFDALLFDLAHGASLLYGMLAVLMALSVGWLAGLVFKK
jgi:uncharacterized protein (TIGR02186 family)